MTERTEFVPFGDILQRKAAGWTIAHPSEWRHGLGGKPEQLMKAPPGKPQTRSLLWLLGR